MEDLINTSYGSDLTRNFHGLIKPKHYIKDPKWSGENNTVSTQANESIVWHSRGMLEPQPKIECDFSHSYLWKLISSLHSLHAWKGSYTKNENGIQLSFTICSVQYT